MPFLVTIFEKEIAEKYKYNNSIATFASDVCSASHFAAAEKETACCFQTSTTTGTDYGQ